MLTLTNGKWVVMLCLTRSEEKSPEMFEPRLRGLKNLSIKCLIISGVQVSEYFEDRGTDLRPNSVRLQVGK